MPTILHQNVQTGSDEEVIVEHDESEGKRQDIVTSPDLEELAYGRLEAISQKYCPHLVLLHMSSLTASNGSSTR